MTLIHKVNGAFVTVEDAVAELLVACLLAKYVREDEEVETVSHAAETGG